MSRKFAITTEIDVYENSSDVQAWTTTPEEKKVESQVFVVPKGGDVPYVALMAVRDVLREVFGSVPEIDRAYQLSKEAANELLRASSLHKQNFNSAHEGWAVLKEELDELWDEVKTNPKKFAGGTQEWISRMRKEAIQVAAMGLRFVRDVCDR